MNKRLTKSFTEEEFECPCCGKVKIAMELVELLQQLRDVIKEPIIVTSGYRCQQYNESVNGFVRSPHLEGLAADIYCKGMDIYKLAGRADLIFSRVGIYPDNNFIHVDIVPPHPSKFWVRRNGKYKYFKPPYNHFDDVMYYIYGEKDK